MEQETGFTMIYSELDGDIKKNKKNKRKCRC